MADNIKECAELRDFVASHNGRRPTPEETYELSGILVRAIVQKQTIYAVATLEALQEMFKSGGIDRFVVRDSSFFPGQCLVLCTDNSQISSIGQILSGLALPIHRAFDVAIDGGSVVGVVFNPALNGGLEIPVLALKFLRDKLTGKI